MLRFGANTQIETYLNEIKEDEEENRNNEGGYSPLINQDQT